MSFSHAPFPEGWLSEELTNGFSFSMSVSNEAVLSYASQLLCLSLPLKVLSMLLAPCLPPGELWTSGGVNP